MAIPRPVAQAATNLITALVDDPDFVAWVSAAEIERRIAAGELVPAEALRTVPGLTLLPIGARDRLIELASHPAVEAIGELADLRAACLAIAGQPFTAASGSPPPDDDAEALEPDTEPEPDKPATEGGDRPAGMPAAMPAGPAPCVKCGVEVDREQAQLSFIRHRLVLCREDHVNHRSAAA